MIILRHFHFKILPEIHFNVLHADSFFRILFCNHNQITAISSQHPITGQRNASCLISNIRYLLGTGSNSLDPDQATSFFSKIVSMIRKYHNHKPKTNPWHREEEPHNHHETPGRQTKKSNQLSLQIQIVLTFPAFVRPSVYSQIGHLLASFLFYVVRIC